jgi:hypothetical protein
MPTNPSGFIINLSTLLVFIAKVFSKGKPNLVSNTFLPVLGFIGSSPSVKSL